MVKILNDYIITYTDNRDTGQSSDIEIEEVTLQQGNVDLSILDPEDYQAVKNKCKRYILDDT